eukprot:CAMPEP_0171226316 /NCGR_PEP_ID=MMETSP0790-20130122/37264_1 /TAXON_ID=2925 /ORGANISM="Alexandrium catenella, Strain OF101" /LENGTH=147 /DNA_ID=CAMNT_0011692385 /DNA_START=33 /DNA_END=474 /DNA_ORIENTATION=-
MPAGSWPGKHLYDTDSAWGMLGPGNSSKGKSLTSGRCDSCTAPFPPPAEDPPEADVGEHLGDDGGGLHVQDVEGDLGAVRRNEGIQRRHHAHCLAVVLRGKVNVQKHVPPRPAQDRGQLLPVLQVPLCVPLAATDEDPPRAAPRPQR